MTGQRVSRLYGQAVGIRQRSSAGLHAVPPLLGRVTRELRLIGDDVERAVVVAVPLVRAMQVPVHEVIDVVSVRYRLVPAARPVHVGRVVPPACVTGRARGRMGFVHLDPVLVEVAVVRMVKVPVVQIVHVALVLDRNVPAALAVLVIVLVGLVAHDGAPLG